MKEKNRIWLLLEKSDKTRVSKSIKSYKDKTGVVYNYDSLVPNHKNINENHFVIIRKENDILGIGKINSIIRSETTKDHNKCPNCKSTDIRIRKNKTPKWKCGKCKIEFKTPDQTKTIVTGYTANIIDFNKFDIAPSVTDIKSCALKGDGLKNQNSIMELDLRKVSCLFPTDIHYINNKKDKINSGQGVNLNYKERRAIELRAMEITKDLYEKDGWALIDTSNSRPYDFKATKKREKEYFIEVKGTTSEGTSIILTHGEVKHVLENPETSVLVVISNINLDRSNDDPIASGGKIFLHKHPWYIDDNQLTPTQYKYDLNK